MSLVADDVSRSTGQRGSEKGEKDDKEGEAREERRKKAEISLFLLAPTVIPAKLKLPKEVSFAPLSPRQPTHSPYPSPNPSFSYLLRTPLWFGVLLTPGTSLPPANQPTNQPRASLMLLLQISGRLLGCLPAGTIGRCVFPSSSRLSPVIFLSFFFPSHLSFYTSFHRLSNALSSLHPSMPIFTFYFTSRSFIIFLISRGYPFVRDNCRKWGGSGRVDGKRFFVARSNLALRHVKDPVFIIFNIATSSSV